MRTRTILCYGDSNTFGHPGDATGRYPRSVRWTGRLQALLGGEYYVIEEGMNGRTTVWDDPIEPFRNGMATLIPSLISHMPIDLVIMALGVNDLKKRFDVTPYDIFASMKLMVETIQNTQAGVCFQPPEILLLPPAPIRDVGNKKFSQLYAGGFEKTPEVVSYYKELAELKKIEFLDPTDKIEVSEYDGIHLTKESHEVLAGLLANKIKSIFDLRNSL